MNEPTPKPADVSAVMRAMARRKWDAMTEEQRSAAGTKAVSARWAKHKKRRKPKKS